MSDEIRPLLGKTTLIVCDDEELSEKLRIVLLRAGSRIRRADSEINAQRHLRIYKPSIVIDTMGILHGKLTT